MLETPAEPLAGLLYELCVSTKLAKLCIFITTVTFKYLPLNGGHVPELRR